MRKLMLFAGATLAAAGIAVPLSQAKGKPSGTGSVPCNDGTVTWSPTSIWPPNHKMKTVDIAYDENEGDGDDLTVHITGISNDQFLGGIELPGSGKPNAGLDTAAGPDGTAVDPDAATTWAQVRAERSGTRSEGRTYTITVECTDEGHEDDPSTPQDDSEDPETTTVNLAVKVPHDQSKN